MNSSKVIKWLAIFALLFGLLTIASGARALFGETEARAALGNVVPFVLWFNFLAGFVYVLAGAGLLAKQQWGAYVAMFLAVATVAVFIALGVHAAGGGAFEPRTVGAMSLRSVFWLVVAVVSYRKMIRPAVAA